MEKQVNIGDQNNQKIGQNPVNQSIQNTEKPRINLRVVGLIIFLCFFILGIGGFYIYEESRLSLITDSDVSSVDRCWYRNNKSACLEKGYCKWSNKYPLCCFKSERFQDQGALGKPICCPKGAICD